MNCPEYGTCHDPEWCQQGGPCTDAARHCSGVGCNNPEPHPIEDHHEPWPPALLASVATSGLSLAIGAYGALTTWSLAPLWVTVVGFGVAFLLAASAMPWRGAWQEMRERRRVEAAFAEIAKQEARQ
jgi:hypothetical protein